MIICKIIKNLFVQIDLIYTYTKVLYVIIGHPVYSLKREFLYNQLGKYLTLERKTLLAQ